MNALELKNVTKSFPDFCLDDLSLTLPSGCIMGLIGQNGAGKSTTIKLILDMLRLDGGQISVLGMDHKQHATLIKEDVGVVLDEVGIPACLNAKQVGKIMQYTYKRWDKQRYAELLQKLSLPDNKPFSDFSRGMKMKLGIAVAMSHGAKLLILDEPTGGLDPVVRDQVVEMFYEFTREEDHSILISSHIVSDLERLCDYVAFLHRGKLLLCEEKDALLDTYCCVRGSAEQLAMLDADAVLHKKQTPYGDEVIMRRSDVPSGFAYGPISIEELFVTMIKEAK